MPPFFTLKRVVSQARARPADVLNVKRALNHMGFYDVPDYGMTPYADRTMFDGIRRFQRANGLRVDGVMRRGHATERAMNASLNRRNFTNHLTEGNRSPRRRMSEQDLRDWKTDEIIRLGEEIQRLRAAIAHKKAEASRETDPNRRAAIRVLIRQLERRLRELEDELRRVITTREA